MCYPWLNYQVFMVNITGCVFQVADAFDVVPHATYVNPITWELHVGGRHLARDVHPSSHEGKETFR